MVPQTDPRLKVALSKNGNTIDYFAVIVPSGITQREDNETTRRYIVGRQNTYGTFSKQIAKVRKSAAHSATFLTPFRLCRLVEAPAPVRRVKSLRHAPAEAGERPIHRVLHQTMPDRVEMDAVQGERALSCSSRMVRSQSWRRRMPRSPRGVAPCFAGSVAGRDFAKAVLIARRRPGKSASPLRRARSRGQQTCPLQRPDAAWVDCEKSALNRRRLKGAVLKGAGRASSALAAPDAVSA